jgi:hypothetical protein
MLAFESALARHLAQEPTVAPLAAGGIVPAVATQNRDAAPTYPMVIYTKISGAAEFSHDGPTGPQQARYQFDVYAKDPVQARTLADALRAVLNGYKGDMVGAAGTVEVGGVFLEDEDASYVDEFEVHWVRQDYMVLFAEP